MNAERIDLDVTSSQSGTEQITMMTPNFHQSHALNLETPRS